ncbi:hypothetical protein DMH15_34920 [Streptomyces sp. WAC 06725]|uniref:hypothetical protein n=1 Tax=Streptomyces sp. WAC 06725 TaxID=2203209 RepID=UPI000F740CD8|nr:hypothetical protein [Streptomyces sp. WAC 06725]RSO21611.1 hypothetical protein DMH15_34920 [Streptomyces sp. WAC 06725]
MELVGPSAALRRQTDRGGIGSAYSLTNGTAAPEAVMRALQRPYGERLADRYACVAAAQTSTQVTHPYVPQLLAIDTDGPGKTYETNRAQPAL